MHCVFTANMEPITFCYLVTPGLDICHKPNKLVVIFCEKKSVFLQRKFLLVAFDFWIK